MRTKFSFEIVKQFKQIKKQNRKLSEKIDKKLSLFKDNPKHPSLRIHKLSGNLQGMWSLSVDKNFRLIYRLLNFDIAYFVDIGTHDEVYSR